MDSMMVEKSLYERPVAPGPPWKSVSPLKSVSSLGRWNETDPGECPGVWIAFSVAPATVNSSPSTIATSGSISGEHCPP